MKNTRSIIKIFLFPYTERTERIFLPILPILPTFLFFFPHTKMLDTPKWFSDCESVNSVVFINISRDYYSGAKTKNTFKRTEKIKSGANKLYSCSYWVIKLSFCFQLMPFLENSLFSVHITKKCNKYKLLEKQSCVSVWVSFAPSMPNVGSRYSKFGFEKKKKKKKERKENCIWFWKQQQQQQQKKKKCCWGRIPWLHLSDKKKVYLWALDYGAGHSDFSMVSVCLPFWKPVRLDWFKH